MTITARTRRVGLAIILALAFALVFVLPAFASTGASPQQIAYDLQHQGPVFVDSNANPTLTAGQVQALDNQIRATHRSIYLVLVDRSNPESADALLADIHAALGNNSSEAIGVSTSTQFRANGYNMPSSIANGPGNLATQVMNGPHASPYTVFQNWISGVANLHATNTGGNTQGNVPPVNTTKSTATTKHSSHAGEIVLIVLGSLVLLGLVIFLLVRRSLRRTKQQNNVTNKDRIGQRIDQLDSDLLSISTDAELNEKATRDHTDAMTNAQSARIALGRNDLTEAARYLDIAERHYARAQAFLRGDNPDTIRHTAPTSYATGPRYSSVNQARATQHHSPVRTSTNPHWNSGGNYGGVNYPQGYYPVNDLSLLETALVVDALDSDRGHGGNTYVDNTYVDQGNGGGGNWDNQNVSAGTSDGGAWQGSDNTYTDQGNSGGGGWNDTSAYSAPDTGYVPDTSSYTDTSSGSDGGGNWS